MNAVKSIKFLSWNVRGLNEKIKRNNVKKTVLDEAPQVVCLQETKWSSVNDVYIRETIGTRLDQSLQILAHGSAGGVLMAWNSVMFTKIGQQIDNYCLSVDLANNLDDSIFRITGTYGPSTNSGKGAFFREIRAAQPPNDLPWLLFGDFNVTLWPQDRSSQGQHQYQSARFRTTINQLQLMDLRLQGRIYTWSSDRECPTFVRLDRFLISTSWSTIFPHTSQIALPNTTSDHCPTICQAQTKFPTSNTFKMENNWLKHTGFKELVTQVWTETNTAQNSHQLHKKITSLRRAIAHWKKEHTLNRNHQTDTCKEALHWLAQQSETRNLTQVEKLLKNYITDRFSIICQEEEDKWHQRAKKNMG